jgi:DNA polymerase V
MTTLTHLVSSLVPAGFPSPAEDFSEGPLDLNHYLVNHPSATFFVRATGDSMTEIGIFPGDILIVDRSLAARSQKIVIATMNGDFTVKRLIIQGDKISLHSANPNYKPIYITEIMDFSIWGVVTYVIHNL